MRICMLTPGRFPTDRRAHREARTLVEAGHAVVVVCRGGEDAPDHDRVDGIDVRRIDPEAAFSGARGVLGGLRYVATLVHPAWRDALEAVAEAGDRDAAADQDTADDDPDADDPSDVGAPDARSGLDAIHVHGLPLVKAALAVGDERGVPVVADLREDHPEAVRRRRDRWRARDRLRDPRALAQRAFLFPWRLGRLETACVEAVDRLVVDCEEARARYLRDCGADPRDVVVVRDTTSEVTDRDAIRTTVGTARRASAPGVAASGSSGAASEADAPAAGSETLPFEFETDPSGGATTPDAGIAEREPEAVGSETVAPAREADEWPDAAEASKAAATPGAGTATADAGSTPGPEGEPAGDVPATLDAPFDHEGAFVVTAREEFARDRGLDTLVEAAALAAEDAADLRLVLLGAPRPGDAGEDYRRDLEALARRRLIGGRTLLATVADPDHAAAHVGASDAFVLPRPSNPHTETTTPPMLYAALAGATPIVATDIAPQRRIVERTGAGLVVPPGDPEAVAAALAELRDPERAEAFAANCRAAIEGAFGPARDEARLRDLYATLQGPPTPVVELGTSET